MALELKQGGVLTHVRVGIFFYGHPPTVDRPGVDAFPTWTLNCRDSRERQRFEALLSAEIARRYNVPRLKLVHVHDAGDIRSAMSGSGAVAWDVVGWVGHGSNPTSQDKDGGGHLLPTLDALAVSQKRPQPGEMGAAQFAAAVGAGHVRTSAEFIIVGCNASDNKFGAELSRRFPAATVAAGIAESEMVVGSSSKMAEFFSTAKASVSIKGETLSYRNGALVLNDETITVNVRHSLAEPTDVFDRGRLSGSQISAAVQKGVVTLTGQIERDVSREVAVRIAKEVPGVSDVRDQLRLTVGGDLVGPAM